MEDNLVAIEAGLDFFKTLFEKILTNTKKRGDDVASLAFYFRIGSKKSPSSLRYFS